MPLIDDILRKTLSLGYFKLGLIVIGANGLGVYQYYRSNRDKHNIEDY